MTLRHLALTLPALMLSLAACNGDDPTDTDDDTDTVDDGTPDNVDCTDGLNDGSICTITGTFTEDFTVVAGPEYVFDGAVFVGDDGYRQGGDDEDSVEVTLTIEAGVTAFGRTGNRSFLAVARGSELVVNGTADDPVIFTSGADSREPGDWGGLIINGRGINNACADPNDCNIESEGNAGFYGGNDNSDSSGSISYLVVTHAGDQVTDTDQLNGIAFQAVGSGTEVDHIQVHRNRDDGIEFFGGAVNVKYAVVTGIHDDSIDWTSGWVGKMQHVVVQQWDDQADRGIEADNNEDNNDATPRSKPMISHATFIGSKTATDADDGLKIRRGTGGNFYSFVVVNFAGDCIDVDDEATYDNAFDGALTDELTMDYSIIADCDGDLYDEDTLADDGFEPSWSLDVWYEQLNTGNIADIDGAATDYVEDINPLAPNWASKGDATSGGQAPSDSFFDQGSHRGGVAPGSDWTGGWVVLDEN
jgi:hypothetical protein